MVFRPFVPPHPMLFPGVSRCAESFPNLSSRSVCFSWWPKCGRQPRPATNPHPALKSHGKIAALIVDGQNNHDWRKTTPVLKAALESCGLFTVDVATSGPKIEDFKPDFAKYGVVVSNYNGADWSAETKKAFEDYVSGGGGFVSVHAADNSFPSWKEYNKMIGVGGWGGRNDSSGPMLRWRDGKAEKDAKGGHGTHGAFFSFVVETRDPDHPDHGRALPQLDGCTPPATKLYSTLSCGPAGES